MSYVTMDHAAWVQARIDDARKDIKGKRPTKGWAAGPDWLSDFHAKVMDILGMVAGGIYNAPIAWKQFSWPKADAPWIEVTWPGHLATVDYNHLTRLVFLCHEARIRLEIAPAGSKYLRLHFSQRQAIGRFNEVHPNLDAATAAFRAYLPPDHRIVYRDHAPEANP